jgi:hypothetical protein
MPDKVNGNNYSGKSNIVSLNSSHTPIQPKSELQLNERDQKLATLQKMADNSPYSQRFAHFTSMANNSIPQQPVSQLSKDNNGLPDNLKQGVESLSGISMDDVKVHYNSDKPAQLNAHAYAQGTDIHIASGQEKHLPHEAWHVVQQKQGRVQPTTMMKAKVFINDDKGLEKEADVMGARALQMKPFSISDYKTEKSVQRKEIIQREVPETRSRSGAIFEPNPETRSRSGAIFEPNPETRSRSGAIFEPNPETRSRSGAIFEPNPETRSRSGAIFEPNPETRSRSGAIFEPNPETRSRSGAIFEPNPETSSNPLRLPSVKAKEDEGNTYELIFNNLGENSLLAQGQLGTDTAFKGANVVKEAIKATADQLKNPIDTAAFVGPLGSTIELISSIENIKDKKTPLNLANGFFSVTKLTADVLDAANTYKNSEIIGSALTDGLLLPGIKAGISAAKNVVDLIKVLKSLAAVDAITDEKTGIQHLDAEDKEIIVDYRAKLNSIKYEIIADGFLNAGELITIFCPLASVSIAAIHAAVNVFKNSYKAYSDYIADRERKRAERIGDDVGIKKVKEDNIEEKSGELDESGNNLFQVALKSYRERELFKNHPQKGKDKTIDENIQRTFKKKEKEFIIKLQALNDKRIDKSADLVNEQNLEDFLTMEKATIEHIRNEILEEKKILEWLAYQFSKNKKRIMNDLIKGGNFNFTNITIEELDKLSPENETYFFNKTREAIHAASNRKHFSKKERLDDLKKLFLNKKDDPEFMTFLSMNYPKPYVIGDTDEIKFNYSVNKLIEAIN